jgi:hypothetical protein
MERSAAIYDDVGGAGGSHGVDVRNTPIAESAALLVEHWDTIEAIPPRDQWKNSNGKF